MKTVVADRPRHWSVEMLVNDEKQHLGPGDGRLGRQRAVFRHPAGFAYACLAHMGTKTYRAQGQNKTENVPQLESINKHRMPRIPWQENVENVIRCGHENPVVRRLEKLLAA